MPIPAKFRYALKTSDDTKWYYWENGTVKESTSPKFFMDGNQVVSPIDWEDTGVGLSRNEKYHGVFNKFSAPLTFSEDAIYILRYLYGRDGYETAIVLYIEEYKDVIGYDFFYKGELDFSNIENVDEIERYSFKANIAELGVSADLFAKEDLDQEIPLDGTDSIVIRHDGLSLETQYSWAAGGASSLFYGYKVNERLYPDVGFINVETSPYFKDFILPTNQLLHQVANDPFKYLIIALLSIDSTITIDYDFTVTTAANVVNPVQVGLKLEQHPWPIPQGAYTLQSHWFFLTATGHQASNSSQRYTGSSTRNLTIPVNTLWKFGVLVANNSTVINQDVTVEVHSISIKVTGTGRLPESDARTLRYIDFVKRLVSQTLGSSIGVRSDYLQYSKTLASNYDSDTLWTMVTSGMALRQLPNPVIKTSISQMYRDLRRWGLGLAIEGNNIRIERLPYFYQKDRLVFTLSEITALKVLNANDYLGNEFKLGYNDQTFDDLNGRYDYNTEVKWSFPTKRVKREIDWSSPYYASIYGIEYSRALGLVKKDTTDSQYDNQTYLIQVDGNPATWTNGKPNLLRSSGIITGVPFPSSVYNTGLTPATTFYHNREYVRAIAYGLPLSEGRKLEFLKSEKNKDFYRSQNSVIIDEDADIPVTTLHDVNGDPPDALFQPTVIEVEAAVSEELFEIFEQNYENRYGVIGFYYNDVFFRIFVLDITTTPGDEKTYRIRGLSSPDNDLTKL